MILCTEFSRINSRTTWHLHIMQHATNALTNCSSTLCSLFPCSAFAQLAKYWDDQLALQQQEADRLRKQVALDLNDFRHTQQLKHTRREWDINRPDGQKIDEPARTGDDDPRLGPASMQVRAIGVSTGRNQNTAAVAM